MSSPVCANCSRPINSAGRCYFPGTKAFCSPMCSDVADRRVAKFEPQTLHGQYITARACDVPGCQVCSGAIRSRAGKGDQS